MVYKLPSANEQKTLNLPSLGSSSSSCRVCAGSVCTCFLCFLFSSFSGGLGCSFLRGRGREELARDFRQIGAAEPARGPFALRKRRGKCVPVPGVVMDDLDPSN